MVEERFFKSSSHVEVLFKSRYRPQATSAFQRSKTKTDSAGIIVGYPAIGDVYDAFNYIMGCLNHSEVSSR